MREIITLVKDWVDDLAHLLMSFVAIGAVGEVIFGAGIFGVNHKHIRRIWIRWTRRIVGVSGFIS